MKSFLDYITGVVDHIALIRFKLRLVSWIQGLYQNVTASVENTSGTPSVAVTFENSVMHFRFGGLKGSAGTGVHHITRTSGTGAPGTTDTYTMYGDEDEQVVIGTVSVYNGADGTGITPKTSAQECTEEGDCYIDSDPNSPTSGHLIFLKDKSTTPYTWFDAGNIRGPQGIPGSTGAIGFGIAAAVIVENWTSQVWAGAISMSSQTAFTFTSPTNTIRRFAENGLVREGDYISVYGTASDNQNVYHCLFRATSSSTSQNNTITAYTAGGVQLPKGPQGSPGTAGANTEGAHYTPTTEDDNKSPIELESTVVETDLSGEYEITKRLNVLRIDSKNHLLPPSSNDYSREVLQRFGERSHIMMSWLFRRVEERFDDRSYYGVIAIPFFFLAHDYRTQHYLRKVNTTSGGGDFRLVYFSTHLYVFDNRDFIEAVNSDKFWSDTCLDSVFTGNNAFMSDPYGYLSRRYGLNGTTPTEFRHETKEVISIDKRNPWAFFDSDCYFSQSSYKKSRSHSNLWRKKYGWNDVYFPAVNMRCTGLDRYVSLWAEEQYVMRGFVGSPDVRVGDMFTDFGFLLFEYGIIPQDEKFDAGRSGVGVFYGYDSKSWAEIFETLRDYSVKFVNDHALDIGKMDIVADY